MLARFFQKSDDVHKQAESKQPEKVTKKIWSVAGGKGGTGKSIIASSIAVQLARRGKKVVIIDADLGSGNLHSYLGVTPASITLADFLRNRTSHLTDALVNTQYENLHLISDANEVLGLANISSQLKENLIQQIKDLDFEYIILDVGAGTAYNNIDFFLISDNGLLVAVPEPTSIENMYRFIRSCLNRKLMCRFQDSPYQPLIEKAAYPREAGGFRTIYELVEKLYQLDPPAAEIMVDEILKFRPRLIMNQVRSQIDIQAGDSIRDVTRKYLGVNLNYIGYVTYDDHVKLSARKRIPLFQEYPNSGAAVCIRNIVNRFLG
ncbi:MAG: AAA family ATPase [bacterium]